jgi:hypothetical protein
MLTLPDRLVALVERAVRRPDGFRLLCRGDVECTATLLGVHARDIDELRGWLHPPERREALNAAVVRAHRRDGGSARKEPPVPPPPLVRRTAEQLLDECGGSAWGLDLLRHGSLETVAILFDVHADVVREARGLLAATEPTPNSEG